MDITAQNGSATSLIFEPDRPKLSQNEKKPIHIIGGGLAGSDNSD